MYVRDAYAAVAVRSSATGEDGDDASYAGQQESYLWVRGIDTVIQSIVQCWASLWNAPATIYREHRGVEHDNVGTGVIVQEMVNAEAAGVMITLDPLTGDPSQITIEGCYGLGIGLAQGELLPDRFCVDKITSELRSQSIATKQHAYRFNPATGDVQRLAVGVGQQMQPCITPAEASQLVQLAQQIEGATGCAQDIEWAIGSLPGSSKRQIFVLQTRPETVWRNKKRPTIHYSTKRFLDSITTRLTTTRSQQHGEREDT
jgi:pyruvate,water dikinase